MRFATRRHRIFRHLPSRLHEKAPGPGADEMIEQHFNPIAFRSFVVASCLALLAGCGSSSANRTVDTATSAAPAAPMPPTGLSATPGNIQASLTWSSSSGAASYHVKRGTNSGGPYTEIASATSPSYTDATVSNGATYFFVVTAVGPGG